MCAIAFSILALQTSVGIGFARHNGYAKDQPVAMLITLLIGMVEYGVVFYCIWNGR